MADKSSLLSFIARRHTVGREDVATRRPLLTSFAALHSARRALSDLLSNGGAPLRSREGLKP